MPMKIEITDQQINSDKKLACFIANTEALIQEAQALRYRVFAEDM
jgi:putative hemolysin